MKAIQIKENILYFNVVACIYIFLFSVFFFFFFDLTFLGFILIFMVIFLLSEIPLFRLFLGFIEQYKETIYMCFVMDTRF